jgi:hypothetical protein
MGAVLYRAALILIFSEFSLTNQKQHVSSLGIQWLPEQWRINLAIGVLIVEQCIDFLCFGLASTSVLLVIAFLTLKLREMRRHRSAVRDDEGRSFGKYERPTPPSGVSTFNLPELRRKNDDFSEQSPRVSGY